MFFGKYTWCILCAYNISIPFFPPLDFPLTSKTSRNTYISYTSVNNLHTIKLQCQNHKLYTNKMISIYQGLQCKILQDIAIIGKIQQNWWNLTKFSMILQGLVSPSTQQQKTIYRRLCFMEAVHPQWFSLKI